MAASTDPPKKCEHGSKPNEDATQGLEVGSKPYEDPTRGVGE